MMAQKITTMPIKFGGVIIASGQEVPVEIGRQDLVFLEREGIVVDNASNDNTSSETEQEFDLDGELTELISEGHDLPAMTMKDINSLLSQKVTRANIDESLVKIKAAYLSTKEVLQLLEKIKELGKAVKDDNGKIDPEKVKGALKDDLPADETIKAAIIVSTITEGKS